MAAVDKLEIAALDTIDMAAVYTREIADGDTPDKAAVDTLDMAAVYTPDMAAVYTPDMAAVYTPDMAAVYTREMADGDTPDMAAVYTPDMAAVDTIDMTAVYTQSKSTHEEHSIAHIETLFLSPDETQSLADVCSQSKLSRSSLKSTEICRQSLSQMEVTCIHHAPTSSLCTCPRHLAPISWPCNAHSKAPPIQSTTHKAVPHGAPKSQNCHIPPSSGTDCYTFSRTLYSQSLPLTQTSRENRFSSNEAGCSHVKLHSHSRTRVYKPMQFVVIILCYIACFGFTPVMSQGVVDTQRSSTDEKYVNGREEMNEINAMIIGSAIDSSTSSVVSTTSVQYVVSTTSAQYVVSTTSAQYVVSTTSAQYVVSTTSAENVASTTSVQSVVSTISL
ncbi:hypothetical protein Btru_007414 [Bulinus truncatus]|nr:hypothetical protein Btru_007414 [Bulinus truncatus]